MTEIDSQNGRRKAKYKHKAPKVKKDQLSKNKAQSRHDKIKRTSAIVMALRDNAGEVKASVYSIGTLLQLLPSISDDINHKLPEWKNIGKNRLCFYQLVMQKVEEKEKQSNKPDDDRLQLVPFVFNLSARLQERLIASQKSESSECNHLLRKTLINGLGRTVELWSHVEMAPKGGGGKEHVQGAMLISKNEHDRVKKALRNMNAKADADFHRFALRLGDKTRRAEENKYGILRTDLNWGMYCYKENARTKVLFVDQEKDKYLEVFSVSRTLNIQAKELFNELRLKQRQ